MSRAKALTDVQKYYIDGNADIGIQKLAVKLDVPVSSVKKYLENRASEIGKQLEDAVSDEVVPEPKPTSSHLITTTASGRTGVAIMTEAASMRADEDLKGKKKVIPANVHRIR